MASKQVIDINRRNRRGLNKIRQGVRFNKKFHWTLHGKVGQYCIDLPADSSYFNLGDSSVPDGFEMKPLDPSIKATYTTPSGEVKDLRDLPSFMELLIDAKK